MIISANNGEIKIEYGECYESRCKSIETLFRLAYDKSINKNFKIKINTGDRPSNDNEEFSFSVINNNFEKGFPCFLFDSWPEIGILDYEDSISKIIQAGKELPMTNKLGWIGSIIKGWHPRSFLLDKSKNECSNYLDIREINWNRVDPKNLHSNTKDYLSITDQIKLWRFLIDVEGVGWSARTKLFFWSNRVLFIVDRNFKEYWWEDLKPWYHYVPVKNDLSDLKKNIEIILNNDNLEKEIITNARNFADLNLRRSHAVNRITKILNSCTTI